MKKDRTFPPQTAGWWLPRLGIRFLGVLLGVFFFWFLGFVLRDIHQMAMPSYNDYIKEHLDTSLEKKALVAREKQEELSRTLHVLESRQSMDKESIRTLEKTMQQLAEIQKLSVQQKKVLSQSQQQNLQKALEAFLKKQDKYQQNNQHRILLAEQEEKAGSKALEAEKKLQEAQKVLGESYHKIQKSREFRRGLYQLAFLVPLLLASLGITKKSWPTLYRTGGVAVTGAIFLRTALTMHRAFPSLYMKYILLGTGIMVTWALMGAIIRSIQHPPKASLLKNYKEGYRHFLCPICEHPIRRGPLRFANWTRKTLLKLPPSGTFSFGDTGDKPYTCPSCGTNLYGPCKDCGNMTETLLPHCSFCGAPHPSEDE